MSPTCKNVGSEVGGDYNPAMHLIMLLAQYNYPPKEWPDGIDVTVTLGYLALVFGLPTLGYVCMALDIRTYLRSLRRALTVVTQYRLELPDWVRKDTPRCILALDLSLPCTSQDILAAYRRKVKLLHPDRGGDRRAFMRLQAHFEQAMKFIDER